MTERSHILAGTEFNFDEAVRENSRRGLVLVDFRTPWAGPSLCQQQVLKRLATDDEGRFLLVTLNTDEQKGIVERFGVKKPAVVQGVSKRGLPAIFDALGGDRDLVKRYRGEFARLIH